MIYLDTTDKKDNKTIKYYKKLGFKKVDYLREITPKSEYKFGQLFFALIIK